MTDAATAMYRECTDRVTKSAGSGPAVLCAHGTLMDRTMFDPQLDALSDEYRIAAYDLRARTEHCHEPYDLGDLVEDCRAVQEALDLHKPVLVGMSMGGFLALRYALEYPETISGLVLIDSMAIAHPEDDIALYRDLVETVREEGSPTESLAETVTHFLFGPTTRGEQPDLVEKWVDRWATYPGEAIYHEVYSWLERPDVTEDIRTLGLPALVVYGEEDAAIAPDAGRRMADALGAPFELIPEAGHSANLERPEPVNRHLREFLETVYG